jgi:hypothetical protein
VIADPGATRRAKSRRINGAARELVRYFGEERSIGRYTGPLGRVADGKLRAGVVLEAFDELNRQVEAGERQIYD